MARKYTARDGMSIGQKILVATILLVPLGLLFVRPVATIRVLSVGIAFMSVIVIATKVAAIVGGYLGKHTIHLSPEEIAASVADDVPMYTVLIPLYDEPRMVNQLLTSMKALDYPKAKLDIMFLLETDDAATLAAFHEHEPELQALGGRVVIVPPGFPRTKARACNYGLEIAKGEFLVIYDAEDWPEADQIRKSLAAFRKVGPQVACMQAKLNYHNFDQNILTRLFTLEYTSWFDLYLPGLHAIGSPIPLGGTSNHLRTDVLRRLGGWDAYDVTEDCDLGIRLARNRLETCIFDSTTWEEATLRLKPWLKQRTHWVKGYIQTLFLHTRAPLDTLRELGPWQMLLMLITVGGSLFSLVISLPSVVLFVVSFYSIVHDPLWRPDRVVWPAAGALLLLTGYFVAVHMVGVYQRRRRSLVPYALLMPFYWVLMSVAALRAVVQFVQNPFLWEKSPHGHALRVAAKARKTATAEDASTAPPTLAVAVGAPREAPRQAPLSSENRVLKALVAAATALLLAALPYIEMRPEVRQEREYRIPLQESWGGRREVVVKAKLTAMAKADVENLAPRLLVFASSWKGDWYQRVVTSYTRVGNQLEFTVPLDESWEAVGGAPRWSESSLRRVREIGVRLMSRIQHRLPELEFSSVEARGTAPSRPIRYSILRKPDRALARHVVDLRFAVNHEWHNPFDPDEVDLSCVVQGPSGKSLRVPAFYMQDYKRQATTNKVEQLELEGDSHWAARFNPPEPGLYRWHLEGRDQGGALPSSAEYQLAVGASDAPGFVRNDPDSGYLKFDSGSMFYPIGINLRSVNDGGDQDYDFPDPSESEGTGRLEEYINRMHSAGISLGRVWLTSWFGGLEWRRHVGAYEGLGEYNLENAWRIDRLLALGEERGVYLELVLFPHGSFQPSKNTHGRTNWDSQWADNPYNAELGGPVEKSADFLTNEDAKRRTKKYLRYVGARYGAFSSLFGWTMWTEVDTVSGDANAIADWHREMTPALRASDWGKHIVSTEFLGDGYREVLSLPEIDYVQIEAYEHFERRKHLRETFGSAGLVSIFDERQAAISPFGKPIVLEEYGGAWWGGSMNQLAQNIHDGLWLGWTHLLSGAPRAWWWNLIFEKGLDRYYKVFSDFVRGEDLRGRAWRQRSPEVISGAELKARSLQAADVAYAWVYDPDVTDHVEDPPERIVKMVGYPVAKPPELPMTLSPRFSDAEPRVFAEVRGAQLKVDDLQDGEYAVEVWDTWSEKPPVTLGARVTHGGLILPLPPTTRDVALKIKRVASTASAEPAP